MATLIKTIKDSLGNLIVPRTRAIAVTLEDNVTNVEQALAGKAPLVHAHGDLYYTETEANALLLNKVDKVSGKGLSTNDYTTTEKNKVANVPADTTTALSGKAPVVHNHDDLYYTETEIDTMIGDIEAVLDTILGGA